MPSKRPITNKAPRISFSPRKRMEEEIKKEILLVGEPFSYEEKLLITVRGITPLSALAFVAGVANVERFKTLRMMNAYLGFVPKVPDTTCNTFCSGITAAGKVL